jgi:hypothetical protein
VVASNPCVPLLEEIVPASPGAAAMLVLPLNSVCSLATVKLTVSLGVVAAPALVTASMVALSLSVEAGEGRLATECRG